MRKPFKQVFRGIAELSVMFTAIFVIPALLTALVNFDINMYFSCIHNVTYCVFFTIVGICVSIGYTSMYQNEEV